MNACLQNQGLLLVRYSCRLPRRGLICIAAAIAIATPGCFGRPRVNVSDTAAAHRLLDESLQAWKSGRSVDELRQSKPPVYVAEELWKDGFQLADFSIDDQGNVFGTNVRFVVTLTGKDSKGKPISRSLKYLVTTTPAMTIARVDG